MKMMARRYERRWECEKRNAIKNNGKNEKQKPRTGFSVMIREPWGLENVFSIAVLRRTFYDLTKI